MITVKTACGREIYFSDSDAKLLKDYTFVYDRSYQRFEAKNKITLKRYMIPVLLFQVTDLTIKTIHIDGNTANYQRENLQRISKSEWYRYRGPLTGKKYKGVIKRKGMKFPHAEVTIKGNKNIRLDSHWGDQEYTAGLYNAMCDYLNFTGYRNNVKKIELTKQQKEYIDNRLKQITGV